ncbi:MAG: antibiotic biosynthesis monooxygenase family protein [Nocardioidaceae bacterium]
MTRFRVPLPEAEEFRAGLEEAHALLARQRGYLGGSIGRNVDDPELWVLQTRWEGPGAYRRGLGAYDVKANAWALLGRALDEPSAYEIVDPGQPLNVAEARETP